MSNFFTKQQQLRFPYLSLLLLFNLLFFLVFYLFVIQPQVFLKGIDLPSTEDLFILCIIFLFIVATTAVILLPWVQKLGKPRYLVALGAIHFTIPVIFGFFIHSDRHILETWLWLWNVEEPIFFVIMLPILITFIVAVLLEYTKYKTHLQDDSILDNDL